VLKIKTNDISQLRELTTLNTHKNIEEQFENIARQLLSKYLIRIKECCYKINEIEFYYYSKTHPDPYVHRHENQLKKACWYFHKKEGTFKGLDITFGNGFCYGGILIRSLETLYNSYCVPGPSKVVDEILVLHGCKKVKELLNSKIALSLDVIKENTPVEEIYKGKRVGLNLKKEDSDGYFINKKYRFCMNIINIKKDKRGLSK